MFLCYCDKNTDQTNLGKRGFIWLTGYHLTCQVKDETWRQELSKGHGLRPLMTHFFWLAQLCFLYSLGPFSQEWYHLQGSAHIISNPGTVPLTWPHANQMEATPQLRFTLFPVVLTSALLEIQTKKNSHLAQSASKFMTFLHHIFHLRLQVFNITLRQNRFMKEF